ncbi:MAG: VF_A0006 family four-cysteine protein [Pseudomonadota bacterium]|nr:VF_A0006 family four-cysteine protein [Pseudomonadota bacterium]
MFLTATTLLGGVISPASADPRQGYDECVLQHLADAKLDLASQLIIQACRENYGSGQNVPPKRRAYNECLLTHLPGVLSPRAVIEIRDACQNRNR